MPAAEMQSFRATTPDLLRGERGWMSQIKTAAPGGGRKMFLTSPFIDQPISSPTIYEIASRFYPIQYATHSCNMPLSTCASRVSFLIQRICNGGVGLTLGVQFTDARNCCSLTITSAEWLTALTAARCIPYTLPGDP